MNNEKEKELLEEEVLFEKHLPSLETAKARIALALQRYRVTVEKNISLTENEPEKVRL